MGVTAAMFWLARAKQGGFIVSDDPPVHIVGHGACAPTVSMALDLPIELRTLLLELESRFLKL